MPAIPQPELQNYRRHVGADLQVCSTRIQFASFTAKWCLCIGFLSSALGPSLQAAQPDPVEALRQALEVKLPKSPSDEDLRLREVSLEKHVKKLHRIGDLRRALALPAWIDVDFQRGPIVQPPDVPVRRELAQRLVEAVRSELKQGDPTRRLAAISLIGDMGVTIHAVQSLAPFARIFTPDLVEQLQGKDPVLRAAAARALSSIVPESRLVTVALAELARTGDVPERRAVAVSIASWVRTASSLVPGLSPTGVEIGVDEAVEVGRAVVPLAARALSDSDPEVKRSSLEAIRTGASTLADFVPDPPPPEDLPPAGRKLSKEDEQIIQDRLGILAEEHKRLSPLLRALAEQVPAVARGLKDPSPAVRLSACQTLEALGKTRLRLRWRDANMPAVLKKGTNFQPYEDVMLPGLRAAVPDLAALTRAGELRLRLAALYALETLEQEAAPAVEALTQTATAESSYLRWGAARALGEVAPLHPEQSVPALAKLLEDNHKDVRITAAAALKRFGPAARPAADALGRAVGHKDLRTRQWAIEALTAMGAAARSAVPALIAALADPEAEVRSAAAQAPGKIDPSSSAVRDALRKALSDPDEDVRRAASDALLSVK